MVENDVPLIDATHLPMTALFTFSPQSPKPFIKILVRLENHPEVLVAAFNQELERRHPVENETVGNDREHSTFGQILHQKGKVVAEIEIGLARRVFGQSAATYMEDVGLRAAKHLITCVFQPPTQVDFLHVGKKAVVQATNLME